MIGEITRKKYEKWPKPTRKNVMSAAPPRFDAGTIALRAGWRDKLKNTLITLMAFFQSISILCCD